ncbi:MAG: zinc ribbon domain-containing protein [Clostridiales bacterium]|nr:zinc ribbon domain-containing protein [Clostridiales bacterium]
MAFCWHCGMELKDVMQFCPGCGTRQDASNMQIAQPSVIDSSAMRNISSGVSQDVIHTRSDSLSEVNRMLRYFSEKSAIYDEYEILQNGIEELCPTPDPNMGWISKWLKYGYLKTLPYWIGGILFFIGLTSLSKSSTAAVGGFWMVVGILIMALVTKKRMDRKSEVNRIAQRINEISIELNNHYQAFGPCLVGYEFSNPKILYSIKSTIEAGRADTIKEAINCILEDHHRSYMEVQMEMTYRAAKQAELAADLTAIAVLCNPNVFG